MVEEKIETITSDGFIRRAFANMRDYIEEQNKLRKGIISVCSECGRDGRWVYISGEEYNMLRDIVKQLDVFSDGDK